PEPLLRELLRMAAKHFEQFTSRRRDQGRKISQRQLAFANRLARRHHTATERLLHQRLQRQRIKFRYKTHNDSLTNREVISKSKEISPLRSSLLRFSAPLR